MKSTHLFDSSWESLCQHPCPEWFRDAKFGIWAHWGPQSVPRAGDWYARNMYRQGSPAYEHHLKNYGHPSKVGYKDIVQLWKAENFDADGLMQIYAQAGAQYFTMCAAHHDNFDCWNSHHHRWNCVQVGPERDIMRLFRDAAKKHNLRFGATNHLERSWSWFNTNKNADKDGPYCGIPYDGNDPAYEDFYFPPHDDKNYQFPIDPPASWCSRWAARMNDLFEQYDLDLFYIDGGVPFGEVGRKVIADFYNIHLKNRGSNEAVLALKNIQDFNKPHWKGPGRPRDDDGNPLGGHGEYREGLGVLDVERSGVNEIHPAPWQTDTCIGDWFYKDNIEYKSPRLIIQMLADIVSKNGNLLLNFPLLPDGTLDERELDILKDVGDWMNVNGEAIFATRPWTHYGEGKDFPSGLFAEPNQPPLSHGDFRFTQSKDGRTLYVIAMAYPREGGVWELTSLTDISIDAIHLLGAEVSLQWKVQSGRVIIYPLEQGFERANASALAWCLRVQLG